MASLTRCPHSMRPTAFENSVSVIENGILAISESIRPERIDDRRTGAGIVTRRRWPGDDCARSQEGVGAAHGERNTSGKRQTSRTVATLLLRSGQLRHVYGQAG